MTFLQGSDYFLQEIHYLNTQPFNKQRPKMVRHALKILQHLLKDF